MDPRIKNLVANDTNGVSDCFEYDFSIGSVRRINLDSSGAQAIQACDAPQISADGRFAVFTTSGGLVPADTNATTDVYVQQLRP